MSSNRITVYKGRDNTESIQFVDGGNVQNLSDITRVKFILNSSTTIDSNDSPSAFDWTSDITQLDVSFGSLSLTVGSYEDAEVVLYDDINTSGVHWGTIDVIVKANYES